MGMRNLTPRDIIIILEKNGWCFVRQKGSHKQYKKAGVAKIATVPDHAKDVSAGVIRNLHRVTGIDEFLK